VRFGILFLLRRAQRYSEGARARNQNKSIADLRGVVGQFEISITCAYR